MGLVFSMFDFASTLEMCYDIPCRYNAFFMDLPVSFVSHTSWLTVKGVGLVEVHDDFPSKQKLSIFFIVPTLIIEVLSNSS